MYRNQKENEDLTFRAKPSAGVIAFGSGMAAPRSVSDMLASQEASRYFLRHYFRMTFGILAIGSLLMYFFASPAFTAACYFGMAFPIITSFVSFLITEWAFEQPSMMFFLVAMMSVVVRLFNLLIAFCVGYLILKMNGAGVIIGLLTTYFAYLVIEIAYIHNKGKVLGQ
jgi:hypothetical protein